MSVGSGHIVANHSPRILETLSEFQRHRPLKPRMQFAVATADILFAAIELPVRRVVHLFKALIMAVGNQVAGTLPSARIAGDGGPWTACEVPLTNQVVEIDRRIDNLMVLGQLPDPDKLV